MSALIRYEAARTALAEAHRVDEVKDIRDKAEAMAAYARQAKDQELILYATEIKVRAERRCGEMLAQMKERGELTSHGGDRKSESRSDTTNLNEVGITADQSSRWQSLASMSEEHFETAVATAKEQAGQVTTAFMLREAQKAKGRPPTKTLNKKDKERLEQLAEAKARGVSMLSTYARLTLTAMRSQTEFTEEEQSILVELLEAIQKVSLTQ